MVRAEHLQPPFNFTSALVSALASAFDFSSAFAFDFALALASTLALKHYFCGLYELVCRKLK